MCNIGKPRFGSGVDHALTIADPVTGLVELKPQQVPPQGNTNLLFIGLWTDFLKNNES